MHFNGRVLERSGFPGWKMRPKLVKFHSTSNHRRPHGAAAHRSPAAFAELRWLGKGKSWYTDGTCTPGPQCSF
jgi:hypothetical protein